MREETTPASPMAGEASTGMMVGAERARSATTSTNGSQPRYYRSLDTGVHPDPEGEPEPHISIANPLIAQESVEMTRLEALHTLDACRHVIATLELTRLRKSRIGLYNWMAFWDRLYHRSFAAVLSSRVMDALYKVDSLFRAVASYFHELTQKTELAITRASSEKEIIHVLQRMEGEVDIRRRRRRRKARHILEKMRAEIEAIPVKVSDDLFDDMKRGVFALDVYCDYHPGDERAERAEQMWSQHFINQSVGLVAVSPFLYRQWRESSVSNRASRPLTTYSSNTTQCPRLYRVRTIDGNREDYSRSLRPASA
ncbi:hypothetical protein BDW72DRAFT_192284 [Aspergillus terricola var. indicus]